MHCKRRNWRLDVQIFLHDGDDRSHLQPRRGRQMHEAYQNLLRQYALPNHTTRCNSARHVLDAKARAPSASSRFHKLGAIALLNPPADASNVLCTDDSHDQQLIRSVRDIAGGLLCCENVAEAAKPLCEEVIG